MAKKYQYQNVTYGARGRKWNFVTDKYSYTTPTMPKGKETADKIARIIAGAVKRTGQMDNLGRANMQQIFDKAKN
jgi:hypothetical protein